jgi:hypothetical protein
MFGRGFPIDKKGIFPIEKLPYLIYKCTCSVIEPRNIMGGGQYDL